MSRVEFSGASSFNKLSIRSRKGRTTYARGSSTPHRARSNLDGARRRSQRKYIKTSSSGLSRGELVGKPASQPAVARLRVSRRGPTIFMFDQLPHTGRILLGLLPRHESLPGRESTRTIVQMICLACLICFVRHSPGIILRK